MLVFLWCNQRVQFCFATKHLFSPKETYLKNCYQSVMIYHRWVNSVYWLVQFSLLVLNHPCYYMPNSFYLCKWFVLYISSCPSLYLSLSIIFPSINFPFSYIWMFLCFSMYMYVIISYFMASTVLWFYQVACVLFISWIRFEHWIKRNQRACQNS